MRSRFDIFQTHLDATDTAKRCSVIRRLLPREGGALRCLEERPKQEPLNQAIAASFEEAAIEKKKLAASLCSLSTPLSRKRHIGDETPAPFSVPRFPPLKGRFSLITCRDSY